MKILLWTRGGFTIVHKKLERGTFAFAAQVTPETRRVEIDVHELGMLLEGVDARSAQMKPRWEPGKLDLVSSGGR